MIEQNSLLNEIDYEPKRIYIAIIETCSIEHSETEFNITFHGNSFYGNVTKEVLPGNVFIVHFLLKVNLIIALTYVNVYLAELFDNDTD